MKYLVIGRDHKDGLEARMQHRKAHLEGAKKMKEEGKLLYAVAMIEKEKMIGSVMVLKFDSEDELEQWKGSEPYITGEVWESVEITECAVPPLFLPAE